jgi:glycine/D-amino acid oxidase-like deaminating enzyme
MSPPTLEVDPAAIGQNFWMPAAAETPARRRRFSGEATVDVAIMGGGFSGLWTAYYLLRRSPGLQVAIIEQAYCGYGASGRNGGWVSPRYPSSIAALMAQSGLEIARRTHLELYDTADEIARVCEREGIDADYRPTGILSIARGEAQRGAINSAHQSYAALGLSDRNLLLDAGALAGSVRVSGACGALRTKAGGTLDPGKLVRGLAAAVERLGGVIHEGTTVTEVADGVLTTDDGRLTARRGTIAATEAYMTRIAEYHRTLLPISSMIILTEPLSDAQWAQIGWAQGEGLASQALISNYLSRTEDGRILYGSRGAPYLFNSRIDEQALLDGAIYSHMRSALVDWFPVLADTRITHAWGGFLGVTRDWAPSVSFDPARRSGHMFGYAGRGVATTNLAARLMAGLVLGVQTGLEYLPMLRAKSPAWEPEPLRWLGARYVQGAFQRIDDADSHNRPRPADADFAKALAGI